MLLEKHFAGSSLDYLLYLPEDYYSRDEGLPLILFLHGKGERGSIDNLKKQGIPKKLANGDQFEFMIVAPVCPADSWWSYNPEAVNLLLDEVLATYYVDRRRVYITGLSMGGYGTWELATQYPQKFAAVAPICGGGSKALGFPERVCQLKDTPVWTFHGAKDTTVPISETEILVETLRNCGGNVKFTTYPDLAHDSWTVTYNNPELYEWFLRHERTADTQ